MSLTASSDWSPWPTRAPGTVRARWRLGTFVAASVVLHAVSFGSYAPRAGGHELWSAAASGPVLRAALVHERAGDAPESRAIRVSAKTSQQDAASTSTRPAAGSAAEGHALGMAQMPVPERWYEAVELDRRAEPLTPVEPVYPAELAGLAAVPAKVRLRLFIDERGTVRKLEIAVPGPHPQFDDAAIRAWEDVRFSPAMKDNVTVKSQKLLELAFAPR